MVKTQRGAQGSKVACAFSLAACTGDTAHRTGGCRLQGLTEGIDLIECEMNVLLADGQELSRQIQLELET